MQQEIDELLNLCTACVKLNFGDRIKTNIETNICSSVFWQEEMIEGSFPEILSVTSVPVSMHTHSAGAASGKMIPNEPKIPGVGSFSLKIIP